MGFQFFINFREINEIINNDHRKDKPIPIIHSIIGEELRMLKEFIKDHENNEFQDLKQLLKSMKLGIREIKFELKSFLESEDFREMKQDLKGLSKEFKEIKAEVKEIWQIIKQDLKD